ncbi:MAG: hypothetical protein N3A57_03265 [Negativicutes bacterium]|nr:hypothetical protein [Negativicutes bacterium]
MMTDYSQGRVKVEGNTVYIDNREFTVARGKLCLTANERASLIAGRLARIYHNGGPVNASVYEDTDGDKTLIINGQYIEDAGDIDPSDLLARLRL